MFSITYEIFSAGSSNTTVGTMRAFISLASWWASWRLMSQTRAASGMFLVSSSARRNLVRETFLGRPLRFFVMRPSYYQIKFDDVKKSLHGWEKDDGKEEAHAKGTSQGEGQRLGCGRSAERDEHPPSHVLLADPSRQARYAGAGVAGVQMEI